MVDTWYSTNRASHLFPVVMRYSKRQMIVSKSTTEDEVVCLARNMFMEGLCTLHLSEKLLGRWVTMRAD